MGNSNSSTGTAFLAPVEQIEERWEAYSTAGWRSMRVRELDELGGPGRCPVQSGGSFSEKLKLLEEHLQDKRSQMQEMLNLSPTKPKDSAGKGSGTRRFMMHTDKRAAERAGELEDIGTVVIGQKELAAADRLSGMAAQRAASVTGPPKPLQGHHSAPMPAAPGGAAAAGSIVQNLQQQSRQLTNTPSRGRGVPLADWRKRVHAARRRTMIVILAMLRLRKGHKHHPKRPFRLDDLSFYIPDHLGSEKDRFIREYQKYLNIQEQIKTLEAALADLGGELGAAADRPLLHQFSQTHGGADGGVLAQLSLPGMSCPESPGSSSRLYRSLLSQRQHAPQPPPLPPTPPAGELGGGDTRGSPVRPIRRSSTDAGRSKGPEGGGIMAAAGAAMQSIQEDSGYPKERELSRRPRPLSLSGAPIGAPNSPVPGPNPTPSAALPPSSARRDRRDSSSGGGAPSNPHSNGSLNSNSNPNGSPGPSGRRLRPASMSGGYDPAFGDVATGRRPSPGGSLSGHSVPLPLASSSSPARAMASPGRAGWNALIRRGSDSGPSPPTSRTASVDRPRRLLKSESHNVTSRPPTTPASGATIARVSRLHVQEQLKRELEALQASASLLHMFLNRCNSSWADSRQWSPAPVIGAGEEAMWLRNDQHEMYQADTLRKIRNGKVAVQLFAGDDKLVSPSGQEYPLWTTDPWTLVEACRPGMMPQGERIKGVPLGARLMCQMVTQVTQLAGGLALDKLYLVLHINEEQEPELTAEMWSRGFYGLKRENVIFLVQEQHPGFTFDSAQRLFVKADGDGEGVPKQPPGSGVSMSQMAWPSEAFILNDAGMKEPLMLPALDYLNNAGVEWVVTKRLKDMSLYSKEGLLDVGGLTHRLHMQDRSRASMVVDVVLAESAATARNYGTVVLQSAQQPQQQGHPASPTVTGPYASTSRSSPHTTELSFLELSSPQLLEVLECSLAGGKLAVGLGRYLYHLPTMKKLLECSTLWRPKLQLSEGHTIQVHLDVCDVTAPSTMHCIPVEAKRNTQLLTAETVDALIPLTQAQDADAAFKQIVTERVAARSTTTTSVSSAVAAPSVELVGGEPAQGLAIVVFITNNSVATKTVQTALYLARPGRDTVHLVTIVSASTQRAEGQAFLDDFARQALQLMLDVRADVLVRGSTGLLDCMEAYLEQRCCSDSTLVVLGSVQLTLNVFDNVMGSVAIAMMRRMIGLPLVVVTQNAKLAPAPFSGGGTNGRRNSGTGGSGATGGGVLKVMVCVEPHSRPLCHMVCGQLLSVRSRGDKLVLAQVLANQLTSQQAMTQRRLMESFHTVTISHRCPADKALTYHCTPGQSADEPLLAAVEEQGIGLLAVQVAAGSKAMPKHLLRVLRSCKGAVLVYQESVAGDGALMRRMKASDRS